jgi:mono/diheme cytochrome c family protein
VKPQPWQRACALVSFSLLGAAIGAACGVSPEPGLAPRPESTATPAPSPDTGAGGLVASAQSACAGVSLDARRDYRPRSWTDGDVSFVGGSLTFIVPPEIPVVAGASARGRAILTFSLLGADPTHCLYRGNGYGAFGGRRYLLEGCRSDSEPADDDDREGRPRDGRSRRLLIPGGTATADSFHLRVQQGDTHYPATVIHLSLPGPALGDGNACTADSCDPLTGVVSHTPLAVDDGDECTIDSCDVATGPAHAPVDSAVCRGKVNFHDRTLAGLGGNGRACADCHMPSERFQLTPAAALARFEAMTGSGEDDPLFRPIDANDFRVNGAAAHDYTNLIMNGLVRVTLPLPPNVKLLDCGSTVPCPPTARPTSETVADVWRSVPSIFNVNITGPDGLAPVSLRGVNPSGGYQLDGRIDTLQNQALAALRAHASVTVDAPVSFLDDVAGFQRTQFSSPSVQVLSDAMAAGTVPLPDPDPELNELETAGKAVFNRSCGQCHGDQGGHPSGTTPISQGTPGTATALIRYHTIASTCPRPVDTVSPPRFVFKACSPSQMANVRTYEITNSGVPPSGTPCGGSAPQPPCVTRVTTSDPGRMLLTGYPVPGGPGDIEHFDNPNLRGISKTAPYFVSNTAATLEEVLDNYRAFFQRVAIQAPTAPLLTTQPGVVPPVHDRPFTDTEVPALLAYLQKI